ncbi:MAG: 2-amino-4-hydroxy-6-hydroxymethyldihydropteridine diphosphokinase [Deltaproteobacteria bacterium]|nr:2-amino-4-hydroxy-6-hydroxymethyldihydropteridine diphosphokinase [Deltaproteobacteria bacterium]
MGSNLGDRRAHMQSAASRFQRHRHVWRMELSNVYETEPVGEAPQGLYLNAVMAFETTLSPREVLEMCLDEEKERGRQRSEDRNAARTLDLDLLLYGDETLSEEDLIVPHPRMCDRAFVLEPLAELAAGTLHPESGVSIGELAAAVHDSVNVRQMPHRL